MSKATSKETVVNEIVLLLKESSKHTVMFHESIANSLGLNITDHKCLDFVLENDPVTAGQLAEFTGLTTGAITAVIDRLAKDGYVRREQDPSDRRKVLIRPSSLVENSDVAAFGDLSQKTRDLCMSRSATELKVVKDFVTEMNQIMADVVRAQGGRL